MLRHDGIDLGICALGVVIEQDKAADLSTQRRVDGLARAAVTVPALFCVLVITVVGVVDEYVGILGKRYGALL